MPRRGGGLQINRRRPQARRAAGSHQFVRNRGGLSGTTYSATVPNAGAVATFPTIDIAGPVGPSIYYENVTAGHVLRLSKTVPTGQTLSVNFQTRTVTLAGVEQTDAFVSGRWWTLAPGNNTVRSNVAATVKHRDAFA